MSTLQYTISSWSELPSCSSNNSRLLRLKVSQLINNTSLCGTKIEMIHDEFGVLFACVVKGTGEIITPGDELTELSPSQILEQLHKYGFYITYTPMVALSGTQLQYLMTLQTLKYDKLRIVNIQEPAGSLTPALKIIAFNVSKNPNWLQASYTPTKQEFTESLNNGSAMNVTNTANTPGFSWDWLVGVVLNIQDVLNNSSLGGV